MKYAKETEDINLAYKVRHALNENLTNLSPEVTSRLHSARDIALSHKKSEATSSALSTQSVMAGNVGNFFNLPFSWKQRIGLALPILAFVVGLASLYESEQQKHIFEIAELDVAVLSDELPLVAYLDHGFNAYLAKRDE